MAKDFGCDLIKAMEGKGYNGPQLAAELKISGNAVHKWSNNISFPRPDKWKGINDLIGINPQDYKEYPNQGSTAPTTVAIGKLMNGGDLSTTEYGLILNQLAPHSLSKDAPKTNPPIQTLKKNDYPEFTSVPKYAAKLSGGPGSLETSDQIEANMMFRTDFLSRKGQVEKMALFEVTGESMQPFIYHGDVVLVDRSVSISSQIIDGKTYAFRDNGTVLIKRLSRQGKMLIASSENHQMHPPYHVDTDNFYLIGKVIWVGHEVR